MTVRSRQGLGAQLSVETGKKLKEPVTPKYAFPHLLICSDFLQV
jgi:hypothetical protein